MAQLLVFLRDNEAERGCSADAAYKPGDVVTVVDDNHQFSAREQQYPFQVIQRPDLTVEQARIALATDTVTRLAPALRKIRSINNVAQRNRDYQQQVKRRRYQYTGGEIVRK